MSETETDCACENCVAACTVNPGWFAPGEAEKAAELLGMPFEEFKEKHLIVDYWIGGAQVYAPRKLNGSPEGCHAVDFNYPARKGPCIFLTAENRCAIHAAKPEECRRVFSCRRVVGFREEIQAKWGAAGNPLAETHPAPELPDPIEIMLGPMGLGRFKSW